MLQLIGTSDNRVGFTGVCICTLGFSLNSLKGATCNFQPHVTIRGSISPLLNVYFLNEPIAVFHPNPSMFTLNLQHGVVKFFIF